MAAWSDRAIFWIEAPKYDPSKVTVTIGGHEFSWMGPLDFERTTEEYRKQMEVGMVVLRDYEISLSKLAE